VTRTKEKKWRVSREDVLKELRFWLDKIAGCVDHVDVAPVICSFDGAESEGSIASFEAVGHEFARDCRLRFDATSILHRVRAEGDTKRVLSVVVASIVCHEMAHFHINPFVKMLGLGEKRSDALHEMVACMVQRMTEGIVDGLRKPAKTSKEDEGAPRVATQNIRAERKAKRGRKGPRNKKA
jgi:hypothetical protein